MEGMRAMLKSAEDAKSLQPEPVSLLELREELRGLALSLQAQCAPLSSPVSTVLVHPASSCDASRVNGDMFSLGLCCCCMGTPHDCAPWACMPGCSPDD